MMEKLSGRQDNENDSEHHVVTYARLMYCPVLVSTSISSPMFTNRGTFTTAPVSSVAGFDPPVK